MSDDKSCKMVRTFDEWAAHNQKLRDEELRAISERIERAIDEEWNKAMASALTSSEGAQAWMPPRDPSFTFFGVDRSQPAFRTEYKGTWKLTLRERIKGAWRGMIEGWREG